MRAFAFQPISVNLSGAGAAGDLRVSLRSGLLRWDLPDWSEELPDAAQALAVTYDVTYTGDFAGGFAFTAGNIQLRLPDGKYVAPRRDGHSQSIELIGAGKTKTRLFSRFEIPAGMTGRFRLVVVNDAAVKAIPFVFRG